MATGNATFDWMVKQADMPLTKERYIEINWWGEKTLADLEGEELADVAEFESLVRELLGEDEED